MFQQDDLIMGSGQLSSEGRSINITAAGSVGTKDLMVFVMPAGGEEVLRMELSASKTAITGVYEAFSRGMPIESGTLTGSVILSASQDKEITIISAATPLSTASSSYA
jgi:hypothetical protein